MCFLHSHTYWAVAYVLPCPPEARSYMFSLCCRSAAASSLRRVPQVPHPSHLSSQPLRVELKHSCPVCPVSSLCRQAMAARCFADIGGLDSDDGLADTGSRCAAAAAAAAPHQAVTAAAIAGSIQGSPLAAKARPPAPPAVINTSSFPQGTAWQAPSGINLVASPPRHRGWQTPQAG